MLAMTDGPGRRRARGRALTAVVVIVFVLAGMGGVAYLGWRVYTKPKEEARFKQRPPVNVETETIVALAALADTFKLPAVVEANRIVRVSAEVSGRIERIHCEEGARCKAGDLLVELNTDLLQADHDRAVAQARFDAGEHRRMSQLEKGGAATARQRDDAKAKMDVSQAAVASARARLERAKIVAPIGGVLNDLPVEKGEYVQPGTAVAEIVDIDTVKVVAQMPERDVPFFKTGDKTQVVLDGNGKEEVLTGEISYLSELADAQTHATRVEIRLDNRARRMRSGQIVRVGLTRRTLKGVIMIPLLAVIPLEKGHRVYVVEEGEALARDVKLGLIKKDRVRVLDGLGVDDKLIVSGHRLVGHGDTVTVLGER